MYSGFKRWDRSAYSSTFHIASDYINHRLTKEGLVISMETGVSALTMRRFAFFYRMNFEETFIQAWCTEKQHCVPDIDFLRPYRKENQETSGHRTLEHPLVWKRQELLWCERSQVASPWANCSGMCYIWRQPTCRKGEALRTSVWTRTACSKHFASVRPPMVIGGAAHCSCSITSRRFLTWCIVNHRMLCCTVPCLSCRIAWWCSIVLRCLHGCRWVTSCPVGSFFPPRHWYCSYVSENRCRRNTAATARQSL